VKVDIVAVGDLSVCVCECERRETQIGNSGVDLGMLSRS